MLSVVLCLSAPASAAPPHDAFALRLLAAHNRERQAVGVPPLMWSEALAAHARDWAGQLAKLRRLAHSDDKPDDPAPEGENLWAGSRRHYSPEQMVGMWLEERARFRPGDTGGFGHYSQIVWRRSREVGCAVADDGADEYLVCRYGEAGNVVGERPF